MLHWLGIKNYFEAGRTLPSHALFSDLEFRRNIAEDTLNLHSENNIQIAARELDGVQSRLQQIRAEQHHPDEPGTLPGVSYCESWDITYPERLDKINSPFSTTLFTLQRNVAHAGGIDTRFMTWPEYFSVLLLSYCGIAFMREPETEQCEDAAVVEEENTVNNKNVSFLDFAVYVRSEIIECYGYITAYEYASTLRNKLIVPPSRTKLATKNRIQKSFIDYYYKGYYLSKSDAASSFFNALPANEQNMLSEEVLLDGLRRYEKANSKLKIVSNH